MSENGEIYTAGKNFTLLPALTALTNSNSVTIFIIPIMIGFVVAIVLDPLIIAISRRLYL